MNTLLIYGLIALAGAGAVTAIVMVLLMAKSLRKKSLIKKYGTAGIEERVDLLTRAVKKLAKQTGNDWNEEVKVLSETEYDEELFQRQKSNFLSKQGRVSSDKLAKKANKIKI